MHKSKCPVCGSTNTVHNGFSPNGTQRYKCNECGYRFRNIRLPSNDEIWQLYQDNKQTVAELAAMFSTSESTIKRRKNVNKFYTADLRYVTKLQILMRLP